jgi:Putative porin
MRSAAGIVIPVSLMVLLTGFLESSTALAAVGNTTATTSASDTNAKAKAAGAKAPDAAGVSAEIEQLKELLRAESQQLEMQSAEVKEQQQKLEQAERRIKALEESLGENGSTEIPNTSHPQTIATADADSVKLAQLQSASGPQASPWLGRAAPSADPAPQSLGTQSQPFAENRSLTAGPVAFSGDFRLRSEPTFGGPANNSLTRTREELRLRLNAEVKLNEDFDGGFSFASGDVNDPISTNQTMNQFFTRKPFEIDRAYIEYHPTAFQPLTLLGGKFAYPWYNTELTWDKDINPEGVAQKLSFDTHAPVLKNVTLVGFELPFAETAGVALANKSITQSIVYGGQLQATWALTRWLTFGTYSGYYDWHGADAVALAVQTADAASPLDGLLPLNSNHVQNSMTTTTDTTVITIGSNVFPTGVQKISAAQFASKFGLFDSIARLDIKTRQKRWPVSLIGDFVQNTEACGNASNIAPAPVSTATQVYSQSTNVPCDSRQRRAYWLEAGYGRTQKKGDWYFSYTRMFIEREAVLSVFNYSELWQGSNIEFHRATTSYQLYQNVQLNFNGLFGRPLVTSSSPAPALNVLKRLQFDVIYSF